MEHEDEDSDSEEHNDWSIWKETLGACLFAQEHYHLLTDYVKRFEPALFINEQEDVVNAELVSWWVDTSLEWGHEAEAKRAEDKQAAFNLTTYSSFARYYETRRKSRACTNLLNHFGYYGG